MSKSLFRELLDKEASPALGCTEPMMFALGGAITRKYAPGKVLRVDMVGCGLMVTGVQAVGIPKTGGKTGAFLASAVGIVNGDVDACKEVLRNVTPEDVKSAEELVKSATFTLDMDNSTGKQVYFKLTLTTDQHVATVIFEDEHHTWTYLEVDGEAVVDNRRPVGEMLIPANDIDWNEFTIENAYNWCKTAPISEFGRAKEAVDMNYIVAKDGLENPRGMGIQTAKVLQDNVKSGFVADDEITQVLIWGTAGADARMGGSHLPAMAAMGDGNQGITALLPVGVYAEWKGASELETVRALAFSCLMLFYVKMHIGRAAATCMCAIAASAGAAAGIGKIQGLDRKQICAAVKNTIVPLTGMLCDGAKNACALKMSIAVKTAISSIALAAFDVEAGAFDGIAADSLEQTVSNIANVVNQSMDIMDQLMVETMLKTTG